ncbi:hypothetical protein KJF94_03355 [Pseudomonas hormoni]|uniref:Uncharacterized protein n=1 Tax=Pseudomonas hormoni TaxID=3093767 RepID=A0ABX8F0S9_9PSED|nr:hypothetical protein [Pseudomonas hormoni]QVW24634.1 hypothetical protein KJF94_03355 [Pseudomonas hormoni]
MSSNNGLRSTAIEAPVHHGDGRISVNHAGKEVFLNPVRGKVICEYRIEPDMDTPGSEFTLRKLFFGWGTSGGKPWFWLIAEGEGENAGTYVRVQGTGFEPDKTYKISDKGEDVDVVFDKPGVVKWPHSVPKGLLNIRFVEKELFEFYFDMHFRNDAADNKREIKFICRQAEVRGDLPQSEVD